MDESKGFFAEDAEQAGSVSAADIASDWYSGSAGNTDSLQKQRDSGIQDDWPEEEHSKSGGVNDAVTEKAHEADQSFTLKYLGQLRTVGRDEIIALAQKGLDYDRQRQKNEELMSRNKALSEDNNQNRIRQAASDMTAGHSAADSGTQITKEEADRRWSTEVREFVAEYGSVDPKTIPEEVWAAVRGGKQLLSAYQSWELKKLRSEQLAAVAVDTNREKSAGSRLSAGSERYHDAITADWYSS